MTFRKNDNERERAAMEDRRRLAVAGSANPKFQASVVKTEQAAGVRQGEEVALPMRVKKEDISEVPLKVPRFQYVDFPSLHQCIQQLSVPPLDNWLEACPTGRPSGRIAVSAKERVPKFKYVDFPSLHHCIKQLSVPPIESWSSGLVRTERGSRERNGLGSASLSGVAKGNHSGQDGAAPRHKREKYTAFPFPGPEPGSIQCGTASDQGPRKPPLPGHLSSRPASHVEEALQNKMVGSDSLSKQPADRISGFSVIKHERGAGSLAESNKMSAVGDGAVAEVQRENAALQTRLPQTRAELGDSLGHGDEFWRTVPESVCPFCQKMFSDPEELRTHQRSHREKRPH